MSKNNKKLQLYISVEWLKAFLKLVLTVIIPYNIVILLLWKFSVFPGVAWLRLGLWGTFAISFVWGFIRKRRAANKEKQV